MFFVDIKLKVECCIYYIFVEFKNKIFIDLNVDN